MQSYEVIMKKRNGGELTTEEVNFFIEGFTSGEIADYQVSAMAMAIYFQGMQPRELADWTMAMIQSGETIDLSGIDGIKADKHSTGGVGDKTTILLAPWVAAAGAVVAKMSGRGLGHTGGTIDKLEAIPGFNPALTKAQFEKNVNDIGVAVMCQTDNLVPADKKLYALRDVTGTVESIPLIASSVMSKKIAAGTDAIILDVETGTGAFMKTLDDAKQLAKAMVGIGTNLGRNTVAVLTNMNQPLGSAVGNSIEVIESIEVLKGRGPEDVREKSLALGSQILVSTGNAKDAEEGRAKMLVALEDGSALEKFKEMIVAQGGTADVVDNYNILPTARYSMDIKATESGYICGIEGQEVGIAVKIIGAGREKKDDILDLSSGVYLEKKVGELVKVGDKIATLLGNDEAKMKEAMARIQGAYSYSDTEPELLPMVRAVVSKEDL